MVGTQERNHVATRQPLNRRTEVRLHHLPEQPAELNDVVVIPILRYELLSVCQHFVCHREHYIATVESHCVHRPTTQVLGLDPDKRPRQRSVYLASTR